MYRRPLHEQRTAISPSLAKRRRTARQNPRKLGRLAPAAINNILKVDRDGPIFAMGLALGNIKLYNLSKRFFNQTRSPLENQEKHASHALHLSARHPQHANIMVRSNLR